MDPIILENQKNEKPFRLVKYFSATSIIVILGLILGLTLSLSKKAREMAVEQASNYNLMLAENLNHQIMNRFIIPTRLESGERLQSEQHYELLNNVVMETIHGFTVSQVNIYDIDGRILYSTDRQEIGQISNNLSSFLRALRGEVVDHKPDRTFIYDLVSKDSYKKETLLRTYRPITIFSGYNQTIYINEMEYSPDSKHQRLVHLVNVPDKLEGQQSTLTFIKPPSENEILFKIFLPKRYAGPIRSSGEFMVLEVAQDLDSEYSQIAQFEKYALIISIVGAFLIYIILRNTVVKGEKILQAKNSEQQKLMQDLGQAQRLAGLGRMIATVSHEIRNPLGIICSTAEFLKNNLTKSNNIKLAGVIVEEGERLSETVTDFLEFARPQEPQLKPIIVENILEENLAFMETVFTRFGIEVQYQPLEKTIPVLGDARMLYRVFMNLLSNARQAMPQGGLLTIKFWPPVIFQSKKCLKITITDTGYGFNKEEGSKIFTPFFTTKTKGSGLGLLIVRNIIESHGGDIQLDSGHNKNPEEGPGVIVTLLLPVAKK